MLIVIAMMVIVAFDLWSCYHGHCYYDLCSILGLMNSSSSRVQCPMVDLPFSAPALLWRRPVPSFQLFLPEVQQTVATPAKRKPTASAGDDQMIKHGRPWLRFCSHLE